MEVCVARYRDRGEEHSLGYANALSTLAYYRTLGGDFSAASNLYDVALELYADLGFLSGYPNAVIGKVYQGYAYLQALRGEWNEALRSAQQLDTWRNEWLRWSAGLWDESHLRLEASNWVRGIDLSVSILLADDRHQTKAIESVWQSIMASRGALLGAVTQRYVMLHGNQSLVLRDAVTQFIDAKDEFNRMAVKGAARGELTAYHNEMKRLEEELRAAETELARADKDGSFILRPPVMPPAQVRDALPGTSVLVSFVEYGHLSFDDPAAYKGAAAAYAALILCGRTRVVFAWWRSPTPTRLTRWFPAGMDSVRPPDHPKMTS